VVGREDGWLEVWDVDESGEPRRVFATQLPESICTVDGGYVTSAAAAEIIVHTFTGKVVAFSPSAAALALGVAGLPPAGGASGGAGSAAPLSVSMQLVGSLKEAGRELLGTSGAGGGGGGAAPAGVVGQGAMNQHQQLVAALHARIAKATAEVEELRRRVKKERSTCVGGGGVVRVG